MGERTAISWSRSTWSPWIGCTEVSTAAAGGGGCDDCYARALDARYRWGGATHWGAGVPRHRTGAGYWKKPEAWNREAGLERQIGLVQDGSEWSSPGFWPVFPSLCDPFDDEVPAAWRQDFFNLIERTPALTWLLLTKRIGNAVKMLPQAWLQAPLPRVWIGATMVNQREADRDTHKLQALPAVRRFISHEPALGVVRWPSLRGIDQVICGGASRQTRKAPEFDLECAYSTIEQCRGAGASPFIKQLGSNPRGIRLKDRAGADPAEWPRDLCVQEFPHG